MTQTLHARTSPKDETPARKGIGGPFCVAVATGCYLSYIPLKLKQIVVPREPKVSKWTGSGFVGTVLGWASLYLLPAQASEYLVALVLGCLGAVWTSTVAERELGNRDDSRIIIDEVVGYWVAIAFMPRHGRAMAVAFVLFRLFDSVKLPIYRWLEDLPAGWGVVMDDVGAGVVANLCLRVLGHWVAW